MVLSLLPFAAQPVLAAQPGAPATTASDKSAQSTPVSFHMRNDSAASLTIQAGDQQFTIEPGKTITLKLNEGVQVSAVNGTPNRAPGTVLTMVSRSLQGNTLAIS